MIGLATRGKFGSINSCIIGLATKGVFNPITDEIFVPKVWSEIIKVSSPWEEGEKPSEGVWSESDIIPIKEPWKQSLAPTAETWSKFYSTAVN